MVVMAGDRRSYGSGALFERADSAGRVSWYGKWRRNGTQVKRRIGPKRTREQQDGLTRRAAEAKLRQLIREIEPTAVAAEPRMPIGELGEAYIEDLERKGRKKSTVEAVRAALRTHLEPTFQTKGISSITYEDVADLVKSMRQKGLSPKTIQNYIGTLKTLYKFAMHPRRRWAMANPAEGIELDGVPRYQGIRYLNPDEVELLVANAIPGRFQELDATMYRTAAMTGLRLGELCALRWEDVDWSASAVRVQRNLVLGEIGSPKSRRSVRSVPMADPVAADLERHFKAAGEPEGEELVFPNPRNGQPLEKTGVLRRMRRALKAAGLDESHRFHDLRHTFGTTMASAGVPMRALQEWMGHADIQTTQRYADYAPRLRDAELVAKAFEPEPVEIAFSPAEQVLDTPERTPSPTA
jgi:integrase